jgi:phosphoesterase RecJ-like protein
MSEQSTIDPQTRELVLERIGRDASFVVATHEHPDGDALGSLIGMHGLLTALGKESEMFIAPSDLPLPREYRCPALEHAIHAAPADIGRRTVVMLDCGNIDRNPAAVLQHGAHLLNIDHHHDNTLFGTLNLVDPTASCTAEIVWDLMHGLGVAPTAAIAEALYIGLVTDTGRFMYENTGPRAHLMAAELVGAGVEVAAVNRRLYEEMPLAKLTLLGAALERVQRFDSGELTLVALAVEDFERAGAEESFSEGIIDHLRSVEGTKVAVLIRELTAPESRGKRKVSLRATGDDVDVSMIARTQGGGGHRRAAGFSTTLAVGELIVLLRREIDTQLRPAPNGSPVPTLA